MASLHPCAIPAVDGIFRPEAALSEVELLEADPQLAGYRYLPAVKADLLRRLGRTEEAVEAYREALALTDNEAEREFLNGRIADPGRP